LPYDRGLGILVAAVVNLHHFVLDGAIWKLRAGPISRVLLRAEPERREGAVAPIGPRAAHGARIAAATALGVLVLCIAIVSDSELLALKRAAERGDVDRARAAADRMRRIGMDSPEHHMILARLYSDRGEVPDMRRELEVSLRSYPTEQAWRLLGALDERVGHWDAALADHRAALALAPDSVPALVGSARALSALGRGSEASELMDRAARLDPNDAGVAALRKTLAAGSL
jgi:tetratricopeptide (TPR) repeat protein